MSREVTPQMRDMLVATASVDPTIRSKAIANLAKSLELPLRQGIMNGNNLSNIFEVTRYEPGVAVEYQLDILAPGEEKYFVAYTMPNQGRIPERHIEGDYVMVPTYPVTSSIDWLIRAARDARWDIVRRAMEVLELSFVKKLNDDGWHLILGACVDRNVLVYDSDATAGLFTKRLVSLMKLIMRRNGGGNSTSVNRFKLTDLYTSPEAIEDIRNWNVDQLDELSRREVYLANDGSINKIFNVNLHDMDELGENQEYQQYFTNELAGALGPSSDVELVVGIDQSRSNSFVMPIREEVQLFEDPTMHRQLRQGWYGYWEGGFACLDNRVALAASF